MISFLPRSISKRLFVVYGLLTRAMTLGVRAVVMDGEGKVLLVRHTYVAGWHLPGGGVERGETLAEAISKELLEEAHIEVSSRPQYFHTYRNPTTSRYDHVALFLCKDWKTTESWMPNREIAEIGFFSPSDLPQTTTRATQERLNEVLNGVPPADVW